MTWWQTVLEIFKYTLPALVVFATAYYLLAKMLAFQWDSKNLEVQADKTQRNMHLRMQAYERLVLLCQRISPPQLMSRVQGDDLTPMLYASLLLQAMKQEMEHNYSQQIYVSDKLWELIAVCQDQTAEGLLNLAEDMNNSELQAYKDKVIEWSRKLPNPPWQVGVAAIKKEVQLVL